jgi:olefin beta-lactone synthetase
MNITEVLQQHARAHTDAIALVDRFKGRHREISYGELEAAVGRLASLLRDSGLQAGDTVLVFHRMSIELYVAIAAILRNAMTVMIVDSSAGRRYTDRCCELLPPKALIASSKAHALRLVSPALRRIPRKWSIGTFVPGARRLERYAKWPLDDTVSDCDEDTPALVSFTSGSIGEPKAAVRTHAFLLAQHAAVEQNLQLQPGEMELVTLPIFVLANLASRVTSILADADLRRPSQIAPEPVVRQMIEYRANRLAAAPALLERVLDYCEHHAVQLSGLEKIFTGGGPVTLRLLERLQAMAPNAQITVVYGSTEAEPISTVGRHNMTPEDVAAMNSGQGLLVGAIVDSLDVRILQDHWGQSLEQLSKDEFEELCCDFGCAGEIVVSGEHVLPGYLHAQADAENKIRVESTVWHRTGDAGYFDDRGRLWLLGRCAARVQDAHGAMYPLGVEQAAMQNASIGQAAMVSHSGQRVLVVTLRNGGARPDFASLLKSLSFANVDTIRIIDQFPVDRRHHSKIDYRALHALLEC